MDDSRILTIGDHVKEFSDQMNKYLIATEDLTTKSSVTSNTFDMKWLQSRTLLLGQLNSALAQVRAIQQSLADAVETTTRTQTRELRTMDSLMRKYTSDHAVAAPASYASAVVAAPAAPTDRGASCGRDSAAVTRVKVTDSLSLRAIVVDSFAAVKSNGQLFYVEPSNHFAVRINGVLLHGNVGMIYADERTPEKIKECKFGTACVKQNKCDYYHDPAKYACSKDVRNYVSTIRTYTYAQRKLRFGSRDHLDSDITAVTREDVSRFQDQSMHDLLCSLLLAEYARK